MRLRAGACWIIAAMSLAASAGQIQAHCNAESERQLPLRAAADIVPLGPGVLDPPWSSRATRANRGTAASPARRR
jgi:hypothetical protein